MQKLAKEGTVKLEVRPVAGALAVYAASISILDYLGEIDWADAPVVKEWYQRLKSRPSFRPMLTERVRGLTPVSHYADLDF